jgi:hypothetical protein
VARKLKTYLTSLGFFDQAVAAPSMKAALEAWGSSSNLFHQGFAREVDDPAIIAAAMAKPGIVLKRPIGSEEPFRESADLPATLLDARTEKPRERAAKKRKERPSSRQPVSEAEARRAAAAFEKAQRKREQQRRADEARRAKAEAQRQKAVAKAQADLEHSELNHRKRAGLIEQEQAALEARSLAEEKRWQAERKKLQEALHRARSSG